MIVAQRLEEVRQADYYDAHYAQETAKPYAQYTMYPVWQQIAQYIAAIPEPNVLELGCGTGGLAHLLHDAGVTRYRGLDFSEEAIRRARARVPQGEFVVADLTGTAWTLYDYNTIVAVEVLEHLGEDLALLELVRPGSHVLFSVPNLNCAGHVRWFGSPKQVADYYRPLLTLQHTTVFQAGTAKWFVCHARRTGGA